MTTPSIPGIHHITAIAGDPQRNLDFNTTVLGLRLVKLTVNFDDPSTYHFYFGDEPGISSGLGVLSRMIESLPIEGCSELDCSGFPKERASRWNLWRITPGDTRACSR